jgi:hypothetical protein
MTFPSMQQHAHTFSPIYRNRDSTANLTQRKKNANVTVAESEEECNAEAVEGEIFKRDCGSNVAEEVRTP